MELMDLYKEGEVRGGLTASLSYAYIQYIGSYDSCYRASGYVAYTLVGEGGGQRSQT